MSLRSSATIGLLRFCLTSACFAFAVIAAADDDGGFVTDKNGRSAVEMAAARAKIPPVKVDLPAQRLKRLPKTMARLREGGTLRVVMLGDSIVNDTARGCWQDLVARQYPKCKIVVYTCVRGSTGCWFYKQPGKVQKYVLAQQPDLVMIGGISHRHDVDSIRDCIRQIREKSQCELLLMTGPFGAADPLAGPDWRAKAADGKDAAYAKSLAALADDAGAEYLDMQAVWGQYIRGAGKPLDYFKRDPIHANAEGEAALAGILQRFFAADK